MLGLLFGLGDVYGVRMARVNITVPDALVARARALGLNVSQAAAQGITEELDRREKTAALDLWLAEIDAQRGPATAQEEADAVAWADEVFGPADSVQDTSASATVRRSA